MLYELHVGTFTPEGTFRDVLSRLDHLVDLGDTAIELMPIAAFPGRRNWGYDGVFPYACAAAYGHPVELKELVDAAHARGLMVLLDVVYNHFGPEGNYLSLYAPQFFTERHQTPGGPASTSTELRVSQCESFIRYPTTAHKLLPQLALSYSWDSRMSLKSKFSSATKAVVKVLTPAPEAPEDTDILKTLKREHDEVTSLLKDLQDADTASQRRGLVQKIKAALIPHTKAEEKVV